MSNYIIVIEDKKEHLLIPKSNCKICSGFGIANFANPFHFISFEETPPKPSRCLCVKVYTRLLNKAPIIKTGSQEEE